MTCGAYIANLQTMGSRKQGPRRIPLIVLTAMVVVLALCAFVYLVLFDTFTLVADSTFGQLYSPTEVLGLRLSFASKGARLRVKVLKDDSFLSQEQFTSSLSKVRGDYVLLTPLASNYAASLSLNVSELLPKSIVLAMTTKASDLFDCTLSSDEESGWIQAAKAISGETSSMSQNVALVYSSSSATEVQAIEACFPSGHLSVFEDDGSRRLFVSETVSEMDRLSMVLALCPYSDRLDDFFEYESTVQWVVDYRLRHVVPDSLLYGIVRPDFLDALKTARDVGKASGETRALEYEYEKR